MATKTGRKNTYSKKISTKKTDYNKEFKELDSVLTSTKLIKFQQWLYSIMIFILFTPIFFGNDINQSYLSIATVCLFGLFLSVYIAQSNRILVLLSQLKYLIEKKTKTINSHEKRRDLIKRDKKVYLLRKLYIILRTTVHLISSNPTGSLLKGTIKTFHCQTIFPN